MNKEKQQSPLRKTTAAAVQKQIEDGRHTLKLNRKEIKAVGSFSFKEILLPSIPSTGSNESDAIEICSF